MRLRFASAPTLSIPTQELNRITLCFKNTFRPIVSLFTIIFSVIIVFAIVGNKLFAGKLWQVDDNGRSSSLTRLTFDSFPESFLTLYVILTNDAWYCPCTTYPLCWHNPGVVEHRVLFRQLSQTWILQSPFFACNSSNLGMGVSTVVCDGYPAMEQKVFTLL